MFPLLADVTESKKKGKKQIETSEIENSNESDDGKEKETIQLKASKKQIGQALLKCIDVRLFGATFAAKATKKEDNVAISVHGPVQINYGVNLWKQAQIYSSQIMSPFRNPTEEGASEKQATTLGRQSRLDEGHYLHHFSVNPKNLIDIIEIAGEEHCEKLSINDIEILKEAMRRGVTWYNSSSKSGCENEMLVWVQLNEKSKTVLPNFTNLIKLEDEKENGKSIYNFSILKNELERITDEIDTIEVYYNKHTCSLKNLPTVTKEIDI